MFHNAHVPALNRCSRPAVVRCPLRPVLSSQLGPSSKPASNRSSNVAASASSTLAPPETSTSAPAPTSSNTATSSQTASSSSIREAPYIYIGGQRVHSLSQHGLEVINSMNDWARAELPRYLKSPSKSWQPADFLPQPESPDFYDQVQELRSAATHLPFDYLVVLVGDMVTEEALPSYMNMLNLLDGTRDETGAQDHPWAHWTRHWTAEENRHGDLLNKYLYLSGRVDMRAVEGTIQRLIGTGMDPKLENNPYLCFIYTSFQERATKISHGNTARLAGYYGDSLLCKITGFIAADEGRHEAAYTAIMEQLFQRDPEGALTAFADMMKKGIVMPAHFMDDGWHGENNNSQNLFVDYAMVADALGVYTTNDYAAIVDHLVKRWNIANLRVSGGGAAEAQEFLMKHADRIRRLADLQMERKFRDRKRGREKTASFSWIGKREVSLT